MPSRLLPLVACLALGFAAGCIVTGGIALAIAFASGGAGPSSLLSPGRADWTHTELTAHLRSLGLRFRQDDPHPTFHGPALSLVFEDGKTLCILHKSEREARDMAGADRSQVHAWGRFTFSGDAAAVERIRRALR